MGRRVKTPLLLQMEATECGAASLGMILRHYGRYVPLAELRLECGVSRDGSKASNVLKAARRLGLNAKGFSRELDDLRDLPTPFIAFWQFNHFLVVEGIQGDKVYLNDPAVGHRKLTWQEFDAGYTGVVLVFEPGPDFEKGGQPPNILPSLSRRFAGNWAVLAVCVVAGLLLVLPGLAMPTFTRVFLDAIVVDGRYGWFRPLMVAMSITLVVQLMLHSVQRNFLRRLHLSLSAKLKSEFYWQLLRLPVGFYSQRYPGEVVGRGELNESIVSLLTGELIHTIISLFTMIFYGFVLFWYDALLTSIGLALSMTNVLLLRWVSHSRMEANMRVARDLGELSAFAFTGIASMESIKAAGSEDGFFAKWSGHYAKATNAENKLEASGLVIGQFPMITSALTSTTILIVGALRVINGDLSIGELMAIQVLMGSFLGPVASLMNLSTRIQGLRGVLTRLDDVLENRPESWPTADGIKARGEPIPERIEQKLRLDGVVELRNITFGYSPLDAPLVEDFCLSVEPGQRVALVGGSGSGKSTIAKLVAGLYTPWSGEILFDGVPRTKIPKELLTNSLGFVEQDIFLFEGTVRDNLSLWDETLTDEAIWRALADAWIDDVVANMPGGLEAEIPESGANMSGGQRQRLEIARALVNDPSILVLDEATSALDAETERVIDENIRRRGITTMIVAHRLSTIRDCDEIIVLEKGKVVERGTHQDLWQQGGAYQRLLKHGDDGVDE